MADADCARDSPIPAMASRALDPRRQDLIPGVIDSTTNFVEHPKVVAQRIQQFTKSLAVSA